MSEIAAITQEITLVPRYVVTADFHSVSSDIKFEYSTDQTLVLAMTAVARGPAGAPGAASTVPGPAGHTPDLGDLELPIDPVLLFLNALI